MNHHKKFRRKSRAGLTHALLFAALCGASALTNASAAFAQTPPVATDGKMQFDIPAGSLDQALRRYSDVSGVQLVYSTPLTQNLNSPGVQGSYTAPEAMQRLLAGSSLVFRFSDPHTVMIMPNSTNGKHVLGPVQVEGVHTAGANGSTDVTATEGTGSYTTNAMTIGSKTPLSIRETPQSVSVVTQQRIQDQNLNDLNSALNQAPGVTLIAAGDGVNQTFYSRGFAINNFQFDGGPAAIMNYGVTPQFDMAEYDHVELLRGADGMWAGSGDPGGTVNLVRKRPLDHNQVIAEGDAGSWSNYRAMIDVTGPIDIAGLGDKVRGRVVMTYQSQDYFYETVSNNHLLLYGVVEADLTPTTLLTIGGSFTKQNEVPWYQGLPRYQNGADLRLSRSTCLTFPWNRAEYTTPELFFRVEQKIDDDWWMKLNLSDLGQSENYKYGYVTGAINPNTLIGSTIGGGLGAYGNHSYLADITVNGAFDLFGRQHQIVAGATYQETNGDGQVGYPSLSFPSCTAPNIFAFNAACPEPASPLPQLAQPNNFTKQWGGYITLRLKILDDLHLLGGIRFSSEENVVEAVALNSLAYLNAPPCNCESLSKYSDGGVLTPYAALNYDLSDIWSAYFSYTDIYKSQASSLQGPLPGTPLPPVRGGEYETGIKSEFLDGAMNASLSLYRINQKNAGISDPTYPFAPGANGSYCCYLAATNIESEGVDAEVTGQILPGWQIFTGYTYNYNFTVYAGPTSANNGQIFRTQSPKHLLKLWTTYQLTDDWHRWTLGFGVNAQSSEYRSGSVPTSYNPTTGAAIGPNIPYHFTQGGYAVFSGRIAYQVDDHWQASLNVNNILDKTYYQTVGSSSNGNWYGDPRNFMFTIRFLN